MSGCYLQDDGQLFGRAAFLRAVVQPHLERGQLLGEEETVREAAIVMQDARQLGEAEVKGEVPRLPATRGRGVRERRQRGASESGVSGDVGERLRLSWIMLVSYERRREENEVAVCIIFVFPQLFGVTPFWTKTMKITNNKTIHLHTTSGAGRCWAASDSTPGCSCRTAWHAPPTGSYETGWRPAGPDETASGTAL